MVVLAILGLTVVLAMPLLQRAMPGVELQSAARTVAATLRAARGLAIGGNDDVAVVIDVNAHTIGIEGRAAMEQLNPRLGLSLYSAGEERVGEDTGRIRFYPDGTSTGGRVRLAWNERTYNVTVDWISGRVAIEE